MYNIYGGRMKRKILIIVTSILILIVLSGSYLIIKQDKNLTNKEFIRQMEENDFQIYDAYAQFDNAMIKDASVAFKSNYQIEFLVIDNIDNARNVFLINKEKFLENKKENNEEISESNDTYSLYTLTTEDRYMYIKRVDNNLLYFNIDGSYKNEVEKIIKKLNF